MKVAKWRSGEVADVCCHGVANTNKASKNIAECCTSNALGAMLFAWRRSLRETRHAMLKPKKDDSIIYNK